MLICYDIAVKRLVLFGDSLFGQVGKDRVITIESSLEDYDVYNCAVGGWDTNDCKEKSPYISKLAADVVVISLGTNDASPWKQVPLETFKENLPHIFNSFSESKIIYFLPPPVDSSKPRESGKEITNENVQPYHDAAKKICEEHNIKFIDSFAVFMPMLNSGKEYHVEDGVHLNDFAYEIIAKELEKLLSST